MSSPSRKVMVTGASGFVGGWLTKKLLDLGHEVYVLSRSKSDKTPKAPGPIEILGNVADRDSLLTAFQGMHTVFHLAGVVGYSRAMRQEMYQTNVIGTQNVVDAVEKCRCEKLVHMSSVVAVGASFDGITPLNENSEYNLHHLNLGYFETKRAAEMIVRQACKSNRIQSTILNPSTIYGPADAKKGSRTMQVKVARGQFPFFTGGGVNVIHIDDVVDAFIRAWDVGRQGERYILSGENILIKDLFRMIAHEAGVSAPRIYLPKPVVLTLGYIGDLLEKINLRGPINSENAWASVLYHWFDNSKAKRELALNPRPAQQAIHDSVKWIRENGLLQ